MRKWGLPSGVMPLRSKEMRNAMPTFEFSDTNEILKFHKLISCHMIFDIKLGNMACCKARYVAGGHQTDPPKDTTYSSVISRDSIRIHIPHCHLE